MLRYKQAPYALKTGIKKKLEARNRVKFGGKEEETQAKCNS